MTLINTYKYHIAIVSCCYGIMFPLYHIAIGRYDLCNSRWVIFNPKISGFCVSFEYKLPCLIWFVHNNYIYKTHLPVTICVVSIGVSKGGARDAHPLGVQNHLFLCSFRQNICKIYPLWELVSRHWT